MGLDAALAVCGAGWLGRASADWARGTSRDFGFGYHGRRRDGHPQAGRGAASRGVRPGDVRPATGLRFSRILADNRPSYAISAAKRTGARQYDADMSPTVFREGPFRFFFFSREETRIHIHVQSADGEAKFWVDPAIELAQSYGMSTVDLNRLEQSVREHEQEIRDAWNSHFAS